MSFLVVNLVSFQMYFVRDLQDIVICTLDPVLTEEFQKPREMLLEFNMGPGEAVLSVHFGILKQNLISKHC